MNWTAGEPQFEHSEARFLEGRWFPLNLSFVEYPLEL